MDVQHALLSKAILHRDLRLVVNSRITLEFFTDQDYRRIYEYLLQHWSRYGTAPDAAVVKNAFPNFVPEDDEQPTQYFIDQLRQRRKRSVAIEGLNAASKLYVAEDDPDAVDKLLATLQDTVIQARTETAASFDQDLTTMRAEITETLRLRKLNPGLRGISTGFPGIDLATSGFQPEQFVVLIGVPKSFKSATLLAMALNVHRMAKVPLFVGFEMSNQEQTDRSLSLLAGVPLGDVMSGNLSGRDEAKVDRALAQLEGMRSLVFSADISSATTVSGVQAKAQEYDPDVIFVDGAYLMQSEIPGAEPGSPQAITSVSRGLKRLAQSLKKPVVVTTQASIPRSKGGMTVASALYSSAWAQDADIFMGVQRETIDGQEDHTGPALVKFYIIESRSGPRADTFLEWDWGHGSVQEINPSVKSTLAQQEEHTPDPSRSWGVDENEDSDGPQGVSGSRRRSRPARVVRRIPRPLP